MKFVEKPNLPDKRVSCVIADYRISEDSLQTLKKLGVEVILSCEIPALYDAVKGHPDMMIHHLGGNRFVTAPEAYEHFSKALPDSNIIQGSKTLNGKYPYDIAYNAASVGDKLICRADCTAAEILSEYNNIISVKQGYSKCSICVVAENAIITSDSSIYKTAVSNGIDVLKICDGYIRLKGMSYGFIGGASGLISKDMLAVNGNINTHPDSKLISDFCGKYGVAVVSLNSGEIEDIGSIIPVCEAE